MSSGLYSVLNREKTIYIDIFVTIRYFKDFYLTSSQPLIFSVVKPYSSWLNHNALFVAVVYTTVLQNGFWNKEKRYM